MCFVSVFFLLFIFPESASYNIDLLQFVFAWWASFTRIPPQQRISYLNIIPHFLWWLSVSNWIIPVMLSPSASPGKTVISTLMELYVCLYTFISISLWLFEYFMIFHKKKREKKHNWKYMYVMLSICMQRDRKWILNYFFVKCDCGWFQYPMCPCHWIRLVVRWRMVGILLWVMLWILCIVIYAMLMVRYDCTENLTFTDNRSAGMAL